MMKRVSFSIGAIALLFSLSALCAPKVGDQAYMEGTHTRGGVKSKASLRQTIRSRNPQTGAFTVEEVQAIGTEVRTKTEEVSGDDLLSEEVAAQIVENCETGIGKKETIRVSAGSFTVCHASTGESSGIWVAPVPFGLVKVISQVPTGGTLSLELVSFTKAP